MPSREGPTADRPATPAQLLERRRQWREANRWEEFDDPLRQRSPEEALRWSGELLDWRRRNGDLPPEDDGSGLVRLQACLARLNPAG